jgi:hypothetical protein
VELARRVVAIEEQPDWKWMIVGARNTAMWVCGNRKIAQVLNWSAGYILKNGFLGLVAWVRTNPQCG